MIIIICLLENGYMSPIKLCLKEELVVKSIAKQFFSLKLKKNMFCLEVVVHIFYPNIQVVETGRSL